MKIEEVGEFIFLLHMGVLAAYVSLCHVRVRCCWRPEEGINSLELEVTGLPCGC